MQKTSFLQKTITCAKCFLKERLLLMLPTEKWQLQYFFLQKTTAAMLLTRMTAAMLLTGMPTAMLACYRDGCNNACLPQLQCFLQTLVLQCLRQKVMAVGMLPTENECCNTCYRERWLVVLLPTVMRIE